MANSWNGPQLGSPIRTDVPELQKKLIALLKQDPTSVADIPSGAKRLVNTSGVQWQVQQYNGSSWTAIGKLMHDVDKLDGYHAAITPAASTIAVRNADKKLEGDITGNAATASSAATLSETLPVNKGGTGATTSAAARTNLGVPPTSHASSGTTYGLGTDTNYGHVRSDGDTTNIVAGEVVVKNIAIGGDVNDLASKRGQIGNTQRIKVKYPNFSDFNDAIDSGDYFCFSSDMSAANAPSMLGGTLKVITYNGGEYVKQIFYIYRTNGVLQRFYNGDNTTTPWSPWRSIITEDSLATSSTPGIIKPGTGMTVDVAGALNVSLNNTVTSTSTTQSATANAVKTAYDKAVEANDKAGIIRLFNSRLVLTSSNNAWTPPVTGWARVTVIGGGGGGGGAGRSTTVGKGGAQGGATKFGADLTAKGGSGGGGGGWVASGGYAASTGGGGGGGAGKVVTDYVYLDSKTQYQIIVGAGGGVGTSNGGAGPEGGKASSISYIGGSGAGGASSGGSGADSSGNGGSGGSGGSNGTGYGGGGGGATYNGAVGIGVDGGKNGTAGENCATGGGRGGSGAVIIEYYDPAKEGA